MRAFLYTGTQEFDAVDLVATFGRYDDRVVSREVHIRYAPRRYLVLGAAVFRQLPWDWVGWRSLDDTRQLTALDAKQAFDEAFDETT